MADAPLDTSGIDRLLGAFTAGRNRSDRLTEVERLDISRPTPVPRDIFDSLVVLHEQIGGPLASDLELTLSRKITIRMVDLLQNTFSTVKEQLPDPCCAFRYELAPLKQPAYLLVDHAFAFACIDRLLGGTGDPSGRLRELSATEVLVLKEVLDPIVQAQLSVWNRFMNLTPRLDRPVGAPRYLREIKDKDGALVARFRFEGFPDGAEVSFIMPLVEMESVLQHPPKSRPKTMEAERERQAIETNLADIDLECAVRVGAADLTVGDLLGLAKGDVVVLDSRPTEALSLVIEQTPKHLGRLMRDGKGLVFRVGESLPESSGEAKA